MGIESHGGRSMLVREQGEFQLTKRKACPDIDKLLLPIFHGESEVHLCMTSV